MEWKTQSSSAFGVQSGCIYSEMSLLELAERIADGDAGALKELHDNRSIFLAPRKKTVRLAEYIVRLKNSRIARSWCGVNDQVLDEAYNLTIDKFCNLPTGQINSQEQGPKGPDCRHYFGAFIICAKEKLEAKPPANAIEAEIISAETLLRLIRWHFFQSCREAKRRTQKLRRRYMWVVDGMRIYLWLPLELPGHRCREWLIANVPDVDLRRPGEQYRVQAVVDRLLTKRKIFYFSDLDRIGEKLPPSPNSIPWIIRDEISVKGLTEAIGDEKADNIRQQRPAIRLLGKDKLRQLIRMIFTKLAYADYVEKDIARHFGLSCATFSRFAGAHWKKYRDDCIDPPPPDLWRNTAEVLSGHPDFVVAAEKAGVWKQVFHMSRLENKTRRV